LTVFEIAGWSLHVVHRNALAHRVGDLCDVNPIGRDDGIVAAQSSLGHRHVDSVVKPTTGDQPADLSCLRLAEFLDLAALIRPALARGLT
jgi:hypothetical protein